uniref:Putative NB-ARC n=1 Tax=Helianthus annuus TaxID=4232 RepID=A0A251UUL8_HELAN
MHVWNIKMACPDVGFGAIQTCTGALSLCIKCGETKITLTNSHSHLQENMSRLRTLRESVEKTHAIYWFPGNAIEQWLSEVDQTDGNVRELSTKFSNLEKVIWKHVSRHGLIQEINTMSANIKDVIQKGEKMEHDLKMKNINRVVAQLPKPITIENVPALKEKLDRLIQYVNDDAHDTIKVHGISGTGKTVLLQHLNNHEAIANHKKFHIVIWLPASEFENRNKYQSTVAGIQRIISKRLGLCIGIEDDIGTISTKIRRELTDAKYLLLLDDVKKEKIDLGAIGIPNNTNGSKIIYTTYLPVSPFGKAVGVEMGMLSDADSWELFENFFKDMDDITDNDEITTIARDVAKLCGGYFALIEIVARKFASNKTPNSWRNGLEILKRPAEKRDIYMKQMEKFLHFSYHDGLDENQKKCFLFSLLYPKEHKIPVDCLFDCWAANGFLGNDLIGEDILGRLLELALLTKGSNGQYVTINKICRAATINLLQEHHEIKCLVVEEERENIQSYNWEDMHWISLVDSGVNVLSTDVRCLKLTTLFLRKQSKLENIWSSFFDHTKELIVLDLYKTKLELELPMSSLRKLKVLYVNGCAILNKLPFKIEGPNNMLEVLDIRGCLINEIPHDIKSLKRLRRLLVSINREGPLSRLMISELSSLKELIIDVKQNDMASNNTCCNEVIEDIIKNIDSLKELTTLQVHFKDESIDVIQLSGYTLKIFIPKQGSLQHILNERVNLYNALQVYIGSRMTSKSEIQMSIKVFSSFVLSCDQIVHDSVIERVLDHVKAIIMMKDDSVKHLDQIGLLSRNIHNCLVQRCNNIKTLILNNHGFSNLETLVLSECSQLEVLFSKNVVQKAMRIKHLEIRECSAIEEINMLSTSGGDILPTLITLVLDNLPRLKRICSDMNWPSLSTLEIRKCDELKELSLNRDLTMLRNISVERQWWENLRVADQIKQELKRQGIRNFL